VHCLPETFARPSGFDALGHLTYSIATAPRAHAVDLVLDTDLENAQHYLAPTTGVLEWADGRVLMRGQTDDLDWLARELAHLPFTFEIRRPAALRAALAAHAQELLRRFQS
jgi:predicted DNA-binding transcriptional regulator YafY